MTPTGIEGLRDHPADGGLSGANRESAGISGGSAGAKICDCSRQAGFDRSNVARLASMALAHIYAHDLDGGRRALLELLVRLDARS